MVVRDFGLPLGEMTGACTERQRESFALMFAFPLCTIPLLHPHAR